MDTTTSDDTKATNGADSTSYQRIAGALWAGYKGENFLVSDGQNHVTVQRADLDALRKILGVEVAKPDPAATGVVYMEIRALQTRIDALVEGRGEAMRLIADRMDALEKRVQSNYEYMTQRLNKTDETVGLNFRSNREEHNQIAVQLNGDNTEDNPGVKAQVATLLMLVDSINTAQENLQALVEKMAPGSLKMPELPANIATKEYVDAATHRLSSALREHIGNVITEAVRLANPPGVVRRVVSAIWNKPTPPARAAARVRAQRERVGITPEQMATVGVAAARAVTENEDG